MKRILRSLFVIALGAVILFLGIGEGLIKNMLYRPKQDPIARQILEAALASSTEDCLLQLSSASLALLASDPKRIVDPAFRPFCTRNSSGQKIWAWYYPGKPDTGALLICHGHGVSHNELAPQLPVFQKSGLNLFFLDFSAHGVSDGEYTTIGMREWADLDAVLKAAEKMGVLPQATPLAAYGRSMGAAALVNGARHLPRIQAFIIEAMFPNLRKIAANDLLAVSGVPDNPLIDLAIAYAEWRTGIAYSQNRPETEIPAIAPRPLLIIHDGKDRRLHQEDFDRLKHAAPFAQTTVFSEGSHVGAFRSDPARFEREFLGFLASSGIPLSPAATQ